MAFTRVLADVARIFEAIGVAVLVVGLIWSVVAAGLTWRAAGGRRGYQALRETFGAVLLLGLEILVAADLITTVAVAPTPRNVAVLGLIVLIRTSSACRSRSRSMVSCRGVARRLTGGPRRRNHRHVARRHPDRHHDERSITSAEEPIVLVSERKVGQPRRVQGRRHEQRESEHYGGGVR